MLLKYFYDEALAHASYLIGCQRSGEAIVIDPSRDVEPYIEFAKSQGLRVTGAAETHIHADFVSGSRELADRSGATLYLSDEGPAEWKYQGLTGLNVQLLHDDSTFTVGKSRLRTLHTPGHTPESISFLLTDVGGGADEPMGIFTGDFIFVGSIGRPDLLETAAGVAGSAEVGARQLYHSMRKFRELLDYLQVWPAHGAGSACGKGLGAIPSTTVGYEKRFNPALQFDDEQKFVDYILADQPETPYYFAVMKRANKIGPPLVRTLSQTVAMPVDKLLVLAVSSLVFDDAPSAEFAQRHVPGTINLPPANMVKWAGFLTDYDRDLYLIAAPERVADRLRALRSIGIDRVAGYFDAAEVKSSGLRTESYATEAPATLAGEIAAERVDLLDVRSSAEFNRQRIAAAKHIFLGELLQRLPELDRDRTIVVQCQAGGRSAIAASILQRAGLHVVNLQGGIEAWERAGLPVETPQLQAAS